MILLFEGISFVAKSTYVSPGLQWPFKLLYAAVPAGGALIADCSWFCGAVASGAWPGATGRRCSRGARSTWAGSTPRRICRLGNTAWVLMAVAALG